MSSPRNASRLPPYHWERMRENEVQHLPVCQAGHVVGVVSLADIVFGRPDEERGTIAPPRITSR